MDSREPDFHSGRSTFHVLPLMAVPPVLDALLALLHKGSFCHHCGRCCRDCKDGIYVTDQELGMIAKRLGIPEQDVRRRFLGASQYGVQVLRAPCPLLEGHMCSVYDIRPFSCRIFPLGSQPLHGQLVVMVANCPGGLDFTRRVISDLYNQLRLGGQKSEWKPR